MLYIFKLSRFRAAPNKKSIYKYSCISYLRLHPYCHWLQIPSCNYFVFSSLVCPKEKKIKSAKKRNGKKYKTQKSVFASPLLTAQSHTLHCNHFVFCSLVCPNRGSHFALTSDMTLCPWRDSDVDEEDELDKEKKIDIFHLIIAYNF